MLVIHNAQVYTQNPSQPVAESIAIDHGRIVAVGGGDEILSAFSKAERFDVEKHAIIPGLTDAHIHLEEYALSIQKVDCETATRSECLRRVAERVSSTPPGDWILGHGWNQNNWEDGYGTAALLDAIAPNHPVYLTHKSLHSAWANSAALRRAGITHDTPDPAGGRIGRLPNGEPDGILFESATNLLEAVLPEPSLEQVIKAIGYSIPILNSMGLTGIHDFDGQRCFAALQILHLEHALKLRGIKSIPLENLSHAVELGLRTGFGDDRLRIGSVKMFADGALGPHTAAMLQPYDDESANMGILMMDGDTFFEHGRMAVENGISLAVHAIGDRANREILIGYAKLRAYERNLPPNITNTFRHRIEHVQVVHPDDLPRFSQLKLIASMQPIHATSDMHMADRFWGSRSEYAYAWRSLLDHQVPLVFGSDAPVESPNPFWGIHAAVTRQRADGSPSPQGWYPRQRLRVEEAIRGYTIGAAFASGMEDDLAKLAPGYLADLLVLDENPYSCEPDALLNIKPLATMVEGEWVYSVL